MNTEILEGFGLSSTEARVYLALLELGPVTANRISERSGVHRRTVYDALETLTEKGLVSFVIEANKKYYHDESPERFLEILRGREKDFQSILPELLAKRKLSKEPQEVTVYRGKKGLKNVHELMLKSKNVIYTFGSSGKFKENLGNVYYAQWTKKFVHNKRRMKIILSKALKGKEDYPEGIETRYVSEEFVLPSSTSIWGNVVFIQIFSEQPIGILLRSREAAESYMRYFRLLWKIAKE